MLSADQNIKKLCVAQEFCTVLYLLPMVRIKKNNTITRFATVNVSKHKDFAVFLRKRSASTELVGQ